jgi:[histone H3]-lysine4 N-trimethyltransferase ASH1L
MALFAGDKGIMTGEELTYDYNFDPFSQKNVQECRCGSASCRGVLGPKPTKEQSKSKEPKDAKASGLSAAKRKIQQVLDESTSKLNKKRKIIAAVTMKGKLQSAKMRATKKMVRARVCSSTNATKERLIKKASSRSIASAKVPTRHHSAAKSLTNAIKKRTSVRGTRTPSSPMTNLAEKMVETVTKATRPPSRRESVRAAASNARENVVRTMRGANSGQDRTIRPISGGATE